ncbi:hypothetical protein JW899_05045 [Candidatus Uhrbacteria bacterium]|nr:hypothetical protein [Candidatus Uhrbacteria bacterium]
MTLRQCLLSVGIATTVVWGLVATVVLTVNPFTAPPVVMAVFYLTLLLALSGTFFVVGFVLRVRFLNRGEVISRQVSVSFRQAAVLAGLAVFLLFLGSCGRLNWLSLAASLIVMTLFELVVISVSPGRG